MRTCFRDGLGVGVVYTPRLADVLDLGTIDVLEIEPQMFWHATGNADDPIRIDLELFTRLRGMKHHKLVHSVTMPLGNTYPHDQRELQNLADSVAALDAPYASEHLSFNRYEAEARRDWTGFLLPPRQDQDGVGIAAARIDEMRRALRVPVAFENGVNYLCTQPGEMSDGEFIRRVAEAADCGILLDLHNLLTNQRNGRVSAKAVLEEIPLDMVWELHLAGGMSYRNYWLDSHSGHIDDELFDLARAVVAQCPNLQAIIFEIMDQHVQHESGDELRADVARLRALWADRPEPRPVAQRALHSVTAKPDTTSARQREQTLGPIAVSRTPGNPDLHVATDPAAILYADLVTSMQEGALCRTTPTLIRLLLTSIGHSATMNLIGEYCSSYTPEPFGSDEALRFIAHVRAQRLTLPYLSEILDLEEALHILDREGGGRTVSFDCDPTLLLRALSSGISPGVLAAERFFVDISRDGLHIRQ